MPDKVGTACHVVAFCFLVEDIFFIFADIDYNPIFSGTVFISMFVRFLVLSVYSDSFDIYNGIYCTTEIDGYTDFVFLNRFGRVFLQQDLGIL